MTNDDMTAAMAVFSMLIDRNQWAQSLRNTDICFGMGATFNARDDEHNWHLSLTCFTTEAKHKDYKFESWEGLRRFLTTGVADEEAANV